MDASPSVGHLMMNMLFLNGVERLRDQRNARLKRDPESHLLDGG